MGHTARIVFGQIDDKGSKTWCSNIVKPRQAGISPAFLGASFRSLTMEYQQNEVRQTQQGRNHPDEGHVPDPRAGQKHANATCYGDFFENPLHISAL